MMRLVMRVINVGGASGSAVVLKNKTN